MPDAQFIRHAEPVLDDCERAVRSVVESHNLRICERHLDGLAVLQIIDSNATAPDDSSSQLTWVIYGGKLAQHVQR